MQKSWGRSDTVVNSPQASKEKAFHVHVLVVSLCIAVHKYILGQCLCLNLVLNLFLIFHHISGLCSYKIRVVTATVNSWNAIYFLENVKTPESQFFEINMLICYSLKQKQNLCHIQERGAFLHFGE